MLIDKVVIIKIIQHFAAGIAFDVVQSTSYPCPAVQHSVSVLCCDNVIKPTREWLLDLDD
jgi:predicted transcriptional regulator